MATPRYRKGLKSIQTGQAAALGGEGAVCAWTGRIGIGGLNTGGGQLRGVHQILRHPASFRAGVEGRRVPFSVVQGAGLFLLPGAWFTVLGWEEGFVNRGAVAPSRETSPVLNAVLAGLRAVFTQ